MGALNVNATTPSGPVDEPKSEIDRRDVAQICDLIGGRYYQCVFLANPSFFKVSGFCCSWNYQAEKCGYAGAELSDCVIPAASRPQHPGQTALEDPYQVRLV